MDSENNFIKTIQEFERISNFIISKRRENPHFYTIFSEVMLMKLEEVNYIRVIHFITLLPFTIVVLSNTYILSKC